MSRKRTPDERLLRLQGVSKEQSQIAADLFLTHLNVIRALLYRYTHNAADVDELSQEVYIRLATGVPPPQIRSMRAFVLTVTRNVGLDWLRHRAIVPIELLADLDTLETLDEGPQAEEIINSYQELVLLSEAAVRLPTLCRRAFTLRKVYGFTQKEIAEAMNISENTVERHLAKAAQRLAIAMFGFYRQIPKKGWTDDDGE